MKINAKIAVLVCSLSAVPQIGRGAVHYFSGRGASNERGYLISDPVNWGLQEITSTTEILGLQNSGAKKCILSLDGDLNIGRWSVECVNNKDIVFDFSPYTLYGSGNCAGASRYGNKLLLKSGTLKCGTLSVPNSGDGLRENVFLAQGSDSHVLVNVFNMTKGTNNIFCVCENALLECYNAAPQTLTLFNSASPLSYHNVFCISNATVRNYKTFSLAGGLENTVRFEDVAFQDSAQRVCAPYFEFNGGISNRLELVNQRILHTGVNGDSPLGMKSTSFGRVVMSKHSEIIVTNASNVSFFNANAVGCSFEITEGSSLMHTNWNKQVQVGGDSANAVSNVVRVAGTGSKLGYNGALIVAMNNSSCSGLLIEDGGSVSWVSSAGGGSGATYISQGASHHNWVHVTGKGSTFTPSGVAIGCTDGDGSNWGRFNSFVVTDEAIVSVGRLRMGYFNTTKQSSLTTQACSNRVEVLNGGMYAGTYAYYAGHDNFLVVSNATMKLSNDLEMPRTDAFEEAYAKDMHVVLGGTNAQIAATGKMKFDRNTDFTLSVPVVGMTQPLLKATGNITFANCGSLTVDWPAEREADVVLAQTEGTLSVDSASLTAMRANLPSKLRLKVIGKSIVLGLRPGLTLIFR